MFLRQKPIRGAVVFMVFSAWAATGFAQKRIVPHLTSATGGFTSRVVLSNLSATAKAFRLSGYNQAGDFEAAAEGELGPFQTMTRAADALFGKSLSHIEIDQADEIAVSIVYQRDRQDTGPAHVHETSVQARSWRVFPGNEDVTWDGLAAVNTGSAATDITVAQIDETGQVIAGPRKIFEAVAPNSKVLYLFSQDFRATGSSLFDIRASEPLALTALRGNLESDFLWENRALSLEEPNAENRVIAHVTSSAGGFRSQVIISNPFEVEKTYELNAYDNAGNLVKTVGGPVAAGHTLFREADQLFGTNVSHFDISEDTEALVSVSYQRDRDSTGPAQVHDLSRFGSAWRVYPGDPSVTWDGLAAVNRGAAAAAVAVWQIDANGGLIRGPVSVVDQLPAQGKALYLFDRDFESEPGAYFEITSSEPLAVIALRGNRDSDFIWENSAVRLPEPEAGPIPPARIDYAFSFDPVKRVAVMVGGYDEQFDLLEDTWLWNGRRWRQAETGSSPMPRSHHGGAFDSQANQMIIFGGFKNQFEKRNDFMAFDGSDWQGLTGDADIPAEDGELVFDPVRKVLTLTVSSGNALQTWERDGAGWQRRITATDPGRRIDQGLVYDETRQRVVMFGGLTVGNQIIDETWEYDGVDWTRMAPAASPPALMGMAMFYDSSRNRVVMFGGMDASRSITGETWQYDGTEWLKLDTPTSPEPRWVAFAAYDPVRGVATLFGGEGSDETGLIMFRDTWEFDGANWRKR